MYYKSNPDNYTRCEKCKHIDREKEECKVTNDKWLVSDNAGTCHQYEGVNMKVKPIHNIREDFRLVASFDKEYNIISEKGDKFVIINNDGKEIAYPKSWFKVVEDETVVKVESENNSIKPSHYKAGSFDVIAFCFKHNLDFATGNIIKYVTRAGKKDKDKTLEDLYKGLEYLERRIKFIESKEQG